MAGDRRYEHCHSGGEQHGTATFRGAFGWLCDACWESVCRILKRKA
jgi:hypothetical protein